MIQLSFIFFIYLVTAQSSYQVHTVKVYGNFSLGYYYSNFYFGTPLQKQALTLDTGSTMQVIGCQDCQHCGKHINPRFNTKKSSTAQIITCKLLDIPLQCINNCRQKNFNPKETCQFEITYLQKTTIQGYVIRDRVLVSDQIQSYYELQNKTQINEKYQNLIKKQSVKSSFGCIQKSKSQRKLDFDGIMGLSPLRTSDFLQKLYLAHNLHTKQNYTFSLCLANDGGIFTIGGLNKSLNIKNQSILSIKYYGPHYNIIADQIKINHISTYANNNKNLLTLKFVLDSGTTVTQFPKTHYQQIVEQIDRVCIFIPHCTSMKQFERTKTYQIVSSLQPQQLVSRFPNISIAFDNGQVIDWTPLQYFVYCGDPNLNKRGQTNLIVLCLAFTRNIDQVNIIGASWFTGKNILFDIKHNKIEVFEANCNPNAPKMKQLHKREPLIVIKQKQFKWLGSIQIQKKDILIFDNYSKQIIFRISVISLICISSFVYKFIQSRREQIFNNNQN